MSHASCPSELRVKTVKYFKSIERVQDEVERNQAQLRANALLQRQLDRD
jgi:glucosamine-6-phosphate deaminase